MPSQPSFSYATHFSAPYIYALEHGKLLSPEEEIQLVKQVRAGNVEAKSKFIEANLRLVVKLAVRYANNNWNQVPDLVQEGLIGLMTALERFDWQKGFKFSTYAVWWIRQSMQRYMTTKMRLIRLPEYVEDWLGKCSKIYESLLQDLKRLPNEYELAEATNTPVERVRDILACITPYTSLDEPVNEDSGTNLSHLLADENGSLNHVDEKILRDCLRQLLYSAMKDMPIKDKMVLTLRYGLDGESPRTYEQIAQIIGTTRSRARQIEQNALKKLKKHKYVRQFSDFLYK